MTDRATEAHELTVLIMNHQRRGIIEAQKLASVIMNSSWLEDIKLGEYENGYEAGYQNGVWSLEDDD